MKNLCIILITLLTAQLPLSGTAQNNANKSMSSISKETLSKTTDQLINKFGTTDEVRIRKGVAQAAEFWTTADGSNEDFLNFCTAQFIPTGADYDQLFDKYNYYFEQIFGHYNMLTIELMRVLHEPRGPITAVDEMFGSWDVTAHFTEDMFNNKTSFVILLNFPHYSLQEKNDQMKNWTPRQWGMARLGDMFTSRVPSALLLKASETSVAGDSYISSYNIYMGNLRNDKNEQMFSDDKVLITHWGLRDELKSHYADPKGVVRQEMIYQVMQRIIDQSIPSQVINNSELLWNPVSNTISQDGSPLTVEPEPNTRYNVLLSNFKVLKETDSYYPYNANTISRKFDADMEMSQADVEQLFISFVSSPVIKEIGKVIEKRMKRKLRPFDIWYNGFVSRGGLNEDELDKITRKLYPDNVALKAALPSILMKLGFSNEKAQYLSKYIDVDPAIGSGHAWGAAMRSDVSHLRTRIAATGMNYKGYNIAVHEFGHNVEQTISLHFVDNYMLRGVPNTAFTEALAFVFQKRDLQLLDMKNNDPLAEDLENLDITWSLYEIMGVSLVDMNVWKWMYANPNATPAELKEAVLTIAKDIWNKYYAPVFGIKDQTILAIYSHMIDAPLYLSAYPLGHLIQFQIEQSLKGKDFASEIMRMYSLGRLTPDAWMIQATGKKLSSEPLLKAAEESLKKLK